MKRIRHLAAGLATGLLATTASAVADDAAPAPDHRALHLIVRGAIDHDALRAGIARELGAPVAEVLGRCEAPCLDVAVERGAATLLYSPTSGAARMRTVALGADAAQWPTLITLLAGNLVRDEAASVLADLPDLEVPATPSTPPVPSAPPIIRGDAHLREHPTPELRAHAGFALGFIPVLSSDLGSIGRVGHTVSIDALVGVSAGSSVLTLSGVADVERGPVTGVQLGGVAAVAPRAAGFQIGGVAAVAGELHGVQLAGAVATADAVDGLQIGGAIAFARHRARAQVGGAVAGAAGTSELQIAGAAAVARRAWLQIAGAASVAGTSGNVQVAGAVSAARRANVQLAGATSVAGTANVQISGAVNVAREVRGLQLAPINVARRVEGVQVGVINVGGTPDGLSFGLINIVPGGRTEIEATIDSSAIGTVILRHGSRRWHNVYGVGGHDVTAMNGLDAGDDVWMYGLGFGPSWQRGETTIDLEAMSWQVNHGTRHTTELSLLNQLRLSVAHDLGPLAVVAGGALNVYVSTDQASPLIVARRVPGATMETGVSVEIWPSAFVGLRL